MKKIVLIFCLLLLTGCTTVHYDIILKNVERPEQAKIKYGEETKINEFKEMYAKKTAPRKYDKEIINKYNYEDEAIKIIWVPSETDFSFILSNKTDKSIKIIWDNAAFVDCDGESHRVLHAGVRYIKKDESMPASIVVRKQNLSDMIIPTSNIYYTSQGWGDSSILPTQSEDPTPAGLKKEIAKYIGKTIQVLLPLEIDSIVYDYIFIFEVKNVVLK